VRKSIMGNKKKFRLRKNGGSWEHGKGEERERGKRGRVIPSKRGIFTTRKKRKGGVAEPKGSGDIRNKGVTAVSGGKSLKMEKARPSTWCATSTV